MQTETNAAASSTDQQIHSELDAIAATHAPPPVVDPAAPPPPQPIDWRMASAGLVLICDRIVAPNWNLEAGEKDALAEGFTQVLSAFFPTTNIDPRVQATLALGAVMLAITAKRTDLSTGKMTPLRIAKPVTQEAANDASAYKDSQG